MGTLRNETIFQAFPIKIMRPRQNDARLDRCLCSHLRSEPHNLGPGWMGFDFASAFGLPVRVINDAAMQALGSYEGGKMLFLGLGTGLGSAMIHL
jgi:hypothetical protein